MSRASGDPLFFLSQTSFTIPIPTVKTDETIKVIISGIPVSANSLYKNTAINILTTACIHLSTGIDARPDTNFFIIITLVPNFYFLTLSYIPEVS